VRRAYFEKIVSSRVDEIANVQISGSLMFAHVTAEFMMCVLAHDLQPSSRDFVRRAWLCGELILRMSSGVLGELEPPSANFFM
jgi:hypothetical protein